ncbi:N-acetyltransferase [Acetobacter tropicalis]|uniref:N-acetyltransferase n=2 Tax=Acetobacteraceae TaxID=433 RepID=A0A291PKA9_9PROT|nr:N-acetyltransferase [Acetobacter tropicalis]
MKAHEIRLATPEDLSAIKTIIGRHAYSHYVFRIGSKPGPMLDNYASLVHSGRVHVALHDETVHGILVLIPEADAMLLDNVAVAPVAQGLGIGRRLLEFAENTASKAGFSHIKLFTNEAMTENLSLYQRIGYTETHHAEENDLRRVYVVKVMPQRLCSL